MNTDKILKRKALAFALVAVSSLGSVVKEQSGVEGGILLDGLLMACLAMGLFLWVGSKRMEWKKRREGENRE